MASGEKSQSLERSKSPQGLRSDKATLGKAVEVSLVVRDGAG